MSVVIGLDLGRDSIKVAVIKKSKEEYFLTSLGEVKNPSPEWIKGGKNELVMVTNAIKALLRDMNVAAEEVVFSLPQEDVISRLVTLPPMKESEVKTALRYEAETFVPYPLEEVQLDGEIVAQDDTGRTLVFAVAAKTVTIESYLQLLKHCSLRPRAIEPSSVSLARIAMQTSQLKKVIAILNLGDLSTELVVCKEGQVYQSVSLSVVGKLVTKAIALGLGMDAASAEEYKKAYGLNEKELEGKVRGVVFPIFKTLAEEIRKGFVAYQEEWGDSVEVLMLCGGGANLPDLAEELVRYLGIEVQTLNPLLRLNTTKLTSTVNVQEDNARFGLVVGLSLRGEE